VKITVVTVCRNAAGHLEEAMASVLEQDWPDLEYLVVDGGSIDGTVALIRRQAERDPRIAWSSEPDGGIADAMNKGIARSTGELVAFLHADDRYRGTDVLSRVAAAMGANPGALWLTAGIREVDAGGNPLRNIAVRRFSRRRLLRNNIILHPATFVRRAAFARVGGFDPSLRYAMDYDLWLRLARLAPPVEVDAYLADFRVHPGSLSSVNRGEALEEEYLVRCRYLSGTLSRAGHAIYHLWRCSRA
jgi:glycosyltransferase involved in cell wall biosynthesis